MKYFLYENKDIFIDDNGVHEIPFYSMKDKPEKLYFISEASYDGIEERMKTRVSGATIYYGSSFIFEWRKTFKSYYVSKSTNDKLFKLKTRYDFKEQAMIKEWSEV